MVFSSPIFIMFFLPVVLAASLLIRNDLRNLLLLLASLVFYAWGAVEHVPLLLFLIVFNWLIGIVIDKSESDRYRDLALFLSVVVDIGGLVYFKYTNFLIDNANVLAGFFGLSIARMTPVLLPLGISFFTFHLVSYVIDIYRGVAPAQRNPINFALYICFFPQLIAGPIIRYHDVETQLTGRTVTLARFASGVERFVLGLGKKVLLANPFGFAADPIFALSASDLSMPVAWFGLLCYSLQLYFDFSGYSDMAIGLGRMFGFEYLENFNYPFLSRSIAEFWRRWHISLSNWFRDYLYTPLVFWLARRAARSSEGPVGRYDDRLPLAAVFLICGIWHGANWTFVMFGAIHGLFLFLERGRLGQWLRTAPAFAGRTYMLAVVGLSWVFFRSESLSSALNFLKAMAGFSGKDSASWPLHAFLDQRMAMLLPLALAACTPVFSSLTRDWRARALQSFGQIALDDQLGDIPGSPFDRIMAAVRPPVILAVLALSLSYVAGQTYNPFIYFRF
jgi:alginate O-acetyltransferase complex protein AlgI